MARTSASVAVPGTGRKRIRSGAIPGRCINTSAKDVISAVVAPMDESIALSDAELKQNQTIDFAPAPRKRRLARRMKLGSKYRVRGFDRGVRTLFGELILLAGAPTSFEITVSP